MSSRSDKYVIEPARPEDGQELLRILEQVPYPGRVSLTYTRRPDAYRSFYKEGEEVRLFVCRDRRAGRIAGLGATTIRDVYINGDPRRVAYLFGLKVAPDYRGRFPLLPDCYAYLYDYLQKKDVELTFTTILSGNDDARQLLEKKRSVMPAYEAFGRYETYALRNRPASNTASGRRIRAAVKDDIPALVRFLNREAQKHNFFPVSRARDWTGILDNGLTIADVFVMEEGAEIIAAGAVWDQSAYKQYVVNSYSGGLKLLAALPWVTRLCGLPPLPAPGETVRFYTLGRWAVRDNDARIFDTFLDQIMQSAAAYPLCLVGVHEGHPLRERLQRRRYVRYDSEVYLVNWESKSSPVNDLKPLTVYLECGAL
ncbi:MAG: hypothetical protein KC897_04560 [Candidatus Omnitrophica bacterium]|nr:hypothetical protein [Candidatus Omnitrophota bacterium]MCB9719432.1 hypothetical protein [Candidatus Omnitrophota bacterium]